MSERIEVQRTIPPAPAADIFAVLCDPQGHVAIDATGMLQDADGQPVGAVGDTFVVHMDRESLNDYPLGKYDVTVSITQFEQDRLIAWTIFGQLKPDIGHVYGYRLDPTDGGTTVTSFYDWSDIDQHWRDARSSRSSASRHCGRRWASSTARSGAAIPGCRRNVFPAADDARTLRRRSLDGDQFGQTADAEDVHEMGG